MDRRLSMHEAAFEAVNLREISAPIPVVVEDPSHPALQAIYPPAEVPPPSANDPAANRKRTEHPDNPHDSSDNTTDAIVQPHKRARTDDTNAHPHPVDHDNCVGGTPDVELVRVVARARPAPEVGGDAKHRFTETQGGSAVPMIVIDGIESAGVSSGGNDVAQEKQVPTSSPSTAGNPSAEADVAEEERLVKTYGMFRLQPAPIPGDDERWLGCNFCHQFPSKKTKRFFLITRSPYREQAISRHMTKLHPSEWMKFQQLSEAEKRDFFPDVVYPAPEVFHSRARGLMKAWEASNVLGKVRGDSKMKSNKKLKAVSKAKAKAERKAQGKKELNGRNANVFPSDKNGHMAPERNRLPGQAIVTNAEAVTGTWRAANNASPQECLAGRKLYVSDESSKNEVETATRTELFSKKSSEVRDDFLLKSLVECFEEIGTVHSEVADLVFNGVFCVEGMKAEDGAGLIFPSEDIAQGGMVVQDDKRTSKQGGTTKFQRLAAFSLFHLLSGVPPSITNNLCRYVSNCTKATEHKRSTKEEVIKQESDFDGDIGMESREGVKHAASDITHATDAKDQWAEKFLSEVCERVSEGDHLFWNSSNSICAQALYLFRKLLGDKEVNKILIIATRQCKELGDGAVEFFLSVKNKKGHAAWAHLLSVRYEDGAAESLKSVLDCVAADWRKRLVGVKSGLCERHGKEKDLEQSIVRTLQKELLSGDSFCYSRGSETHPFQLCPLPLASGLQREVNAKFDPAQQQASNHEETNGYHEQNTDAAKQDSSARVDSEAMKKDPAAGNNLVSSRKPVDRPFPLESVWSMSLPTSEHPHKRERSNFSNEPYTATASSRAVDPVLERIMWARGLLCLHNLNARAAKVLKRDKRGNQRILTPREIWMSRAFGDWMNIQDLN